MPLARGKKKLTKRKALKPKGKKVKKAKKVLKKKSLKKAAIKKQPFVKPAAKQISPGVSPKPQEKPKLEPQEQEIGTVTHYFNKISVGIIKLSEPLKLGDRIHIKGVHDDFTQAIESLQFDHKDIALGEKGMEVGIKVSQPVHENDKVYRAA